MTVIGAFRAEHLAVQVILDLCYYSETSDQEMPI